MKLEQKIIVVHTKQICISNINFMNNFKYNSKFAKDQRKNQCISTWQVPMPLMR